jgi:hypothetical protein
MKEKVWYASRKLWIGVGTCTLATLVAFFGERLGMRPDIVPDLVVGILGVGSVLIGGHALTDSAAARRAEGDLALKPSVEGVGAFLQRVGATWAGTPEAQEAAVGPEAGESAESERVEGER